jgi:hypothetical protein
VTVAPLAVLVGGAVALVALAMCVLRRSLLALAVGSGLGALGLALALGVLGHEATAVVVVGAGVSSSALLASVAVAVHRRRGADFVDELREMGGG